MKRNLQLDIVRGVAILLVLGAHFEVVAPATGAVGWLAHVWYSKGAFGVPLFFVLSGFLIGGLLVGELQKKGSIAIPRFLVRRGLKIYPSYYVFMGYLMTMVLIRAIRGGQPADEALSAMFGNFWPSLLFVQNYIGLPVAGHTWSLAVEEHFYILLPIAISLLVAARRIAWLMPLCLLAPVAFVGLRWMLLLAGDPYITNTARVMAATHLTIDALLLGVGLRALAAFHPDAFARLRPWRYVLLFGGIALVAWWPVFKIHGVPSTRVIPISAISAAAILIGIYHSHAHDLGFLARPATVLATIVGWIGIRSYSIYLWHVTLIRIAERLIVPRLPGAEGSTLGWIAAAVTLTAVAVLGGALTAALVEKPVLYLRDKYFPSRSA